MDLLNLKTTLLLILIFFITLSSSSSTTNNKSPITFIFSQQQQLEEPISTSKSSKNDSNANNADVDDDEQQKLRLEVLKADDYEKDLLNINNYNITSDLIHEFITSTIQQLNVEDEVEKNENENVQEKDSTSTNLNNSTTEETETQHLRFVRNVDIRMGNDTTFSRGIHGRQLHGFQGTPSEDANPNVMMIPREVLQQSFEAAQDGWLTRQRSIENMWMNSGGGSDPRSPVGTQYAFSAPNTHSLALSNTSALLEIASRAFLQNLKSEAAGLRGVRQKRQISNTIFDNEAMSSMMSSQMMQVNVKQFFQKPDMTSGNCGKNEPTICNKNSPHRSYSGICNNLGNPNWGRSVNTLDRMLPPMYSDGISAPKMHSVTGQLLPSPRYVSSSVHIDVSHLSKKHTLLLMQYGQFLDHDITFTPVHKGPNGILNCRDCLSTKEVHPECWPIQVPFGDSYYPDREINTGKSYCIPFTRSLPGQQRLGPREQINQNSAYIDNSQIYGENLCKTMGLRSHSGYLNATFYPAGKHLLPQTSNIGECKSKSGFCFQAGDSRASEQPALAAVHTVFLREHNRLVDGLHQINPGWNDEKLFQQARRILIATNQHIIFNEFLPRIIGATMMNAYELRLEQSYYYTNYDASCAAATYNEFATAAFRFGHSMVRSQLPRMNDHYHGMSPTIPLRDGFFNSDMLMKPLMIDEVIRGLLAEPMEELDPFVTTEITNHLFEDKTKAFSGMDLISLNIHRGRDHGLQGYNAYRVACNLRKAYTFEDLASEISPDVIERLKLVYAHVDDVDLFTGGLVERATTGGLVGPTFACIIGNQFKRLRKCDRFWYESNDPIVQFSPQQLAEIRKITLAKIVCDNLDITADIQKQAFDAPHNILNPRLPCERLPSINLEAWRDNAVIRPPPSIPASYIAPPPATVCNIGATSVPLGGSGMSSPCVSCICTSEGTKCASLRITNCAQLLRQNRYEAVFADSICTSQCGHVLNKGSKVIVKTPHSRFHSFFKNAIDTN